jgi:hypothetical protein
MHPALTAALVLASLCFLAPHPVSADWTLYQGDCATGLDYSSDGFSSGSAATASQGSCGGVAADDGPDVGVDFHTGSPCNLGDGNTLHYVPNGQMTNVYLNDATQVGWGRR